MNFKKIYSQRIFVGKIENYFKLIIQFLKKVFKIQEIKFLTLNMKEYKYEKV